MHVGFNLDEKESFESYTKIGKHNQNLMFIKDVYGVLVHNAPFKVIRKAQQQPTQQAGTLNLKEFYHEILSTPLTENLLNDILTYTQERNTRNKEGDRMHEENSRTINQMDV